MVMIGSRALFPAAAAAIAPPLADPTAASPMTVPIDPSAITGGAPVVRDQIAAARGPSLWDKLGEATGGKNSAGAWLRAGATLLNGGGIGDAIGAGAGYVDRQRALAAAAQQQGFDNSLALDRENLARFIATNSANVGLMGAANQSSQIAETGRHNRASEGIEANGQRVTMRGQDVSAATQRRGQDVDRANNLTNAATSTGNNVRDNQTRTYGDNLDYLGKSNPAGIGSKNVPYTETTTTTPGTPAVNGWFSDTPAVPTIKTTVHAPVAAPAAAAASAAPPVAAVQALKANPALKPQFEAKYGVGTAAQFLGGR